MVSFNKVYLMGNLTRDPELRYTSGGNPVCNLGLAVNHRYRTQNNELKEEVCFVTITVWGKQAENCNEYLSKGRAVFLEGRLQQRSWEAEDGQKRTRLEVVAENIQFLPRVAPGTQPNAAAGEHYQGDNPPPESVPPHDDIPF
ncbi:MAG: single-stranded DNA-binding protein [Candidatus Schekmanbacteria bacterium]|nr:single-stranded DNA-binding protein [Candidatus Schekmanbacteria bacterium]